VDAIHCQHGQECVERAGAVALRLLLIFVSFFIERALTFGQNPKEKNT